MNISDRIQQLRKAKGISQEELADKIGVSRQSVSKWESEQSMPDIDKIILMSEFFGVTTDYLLKGIEPAPADKSGQKPKPNAGFFAIAATAVNILGLIVAVLVWLEKQSLIATAVGLILMVMGCMIYRFGMTVGDSADKAAAKKSFWSVNVWILSFVPLSIVYNLFFGQFFVPVPIPNDPIVWFLLFWAVYITIGTVTTLIIRRLQRGN